MSKETMIPPLHPQSTITKISDTARAIVALDEEYQKLEMEIKHHKRSIANCEVRKDAIDSAIRKCSSSLY